MRYFVFRSSQSEQFTMREESRKIRKWARGNYYRCRLPPVFNRPLVTSARPRFSSGCPKVAPNRQTPKNPSHSRGHQNGTPPCSTARSLETGKTQSTVVQYSTLYRDGVMEPVRVFLVDDEPNLVVTMPQILEQHGFSVTAVG